MSKHLKSSSPPPKYSNTTAVWRAAHLPSSAGIEVLVLLVVQLYRSLLPAHWKNHKLLASDELYSCFLGFHPDNGLKNETSPQLRATVGVRKNVDISLLHLSAQEMQLAECLNTRTSLMRFERSLLRLYSALYCFLLADMYIKRNFPSLVLAFPRHVIGPCFEKKLLSLDLVVSQRLRLSTWQR